MTSHLPLTSPPTYSRVLHFRVKKKYRFQSGAIVKDVRYFPKGIFPSGNFPRVFSQVATSQMCNFSSGNFPSLS